MIADGRAIQNVRRDRADDRDTKVAHSRRPGHQGPEYPWKRIGAESGACDPTSSERDESTSRRPQKSVRIPKSLAGSLASLLRPALPSRRLEFFASNRPTLLEVLQDVREQPPGSFSRFYENEIAR